MKTAIVLLLAGAVIASAYSYYQKRFPQQRAQSTEQYEDAETKPESSDVQSNSCTSACPCSAYRSAALCNDNRRAPKAMFSYRLR